jgi:hypothetical protein
MGEVDKTKRDIRFGKEGIERLDRLASLSGDSPGEIARQALIEYELSRAHFRDTVCSAVLNLFRAQVPDELYDPAEDTRQEEAVRQLGALLGSIYAAEGIQQALIRMINQQGETTMATYRETSTEPDTFFVDEIEEATLPVIQAIGGTVEYDPTIKRIDGHMGRTRVTLPAGCTYTGQQSGLNPQTIILPGGRRLCVIPGQMDVRLQFLAGESSDPSKWNGAQRIPDTDDEEDEQ